MAKKRKRRPKKDNEHQYQQQSDGFIEIFSSDEIENPEGQKFKDAVMKIFSTGEHETIRTQEPTGRRSRGIQQRASQIYLSEEVPELYDTTATVVPNHERERNETSGDAIGNGSKVRGHAPQVKRHVETFDRQTKRRTLRQTAVEESKSEVPERKKHKEVKGVSSDRKAKWDEEKTSATSTGSMKTPDKNLPILSPGSLARATVLQARTLLPDFLRNDPGVGAGNSYMSSNKRSLCNKTKWDHCEDFISLNESDEDLPVDITPNHSTPTIRSLYQGAPSRRQAVEATYHGIPDNVTAVKIRKVESATQQVFNHGSQNIPAVPSHPHTYRSRTRVDFLEHAKQDNEDFYNYAPNSAAPVKELTLCDEQSNLVELICSGRNVFYTGSAGCGKSTVLKAFVRRLGQQGVIDIGYNGLSRGRRVKVDIIAPTGKSALQINGRTFYTYAGWTPDHMKKSREELMLGAHGSFVWKRLCATDVLVIDEISMMENFHFERLNLLLQEARNNDRPFGGVQVVVTGDFCQLPPVKPFQYCLECGHELRIVHATETAYACPLRHGTWPDSQKWAFCSAAWKHCNFTHVNLTTIHRQSDVGFINILERCRLGAPLIPEEEHLLLNHECQVSNAVKLYPRLDKVRQVNQVAFRKINSRPRSYQCYDNFRQRAEEEEANQVMNISQSAGRKRLEDGTLQSLRGHQYESCVELKQSMLVVLLVNLDVEAGLVNGSQGKILKFTKVDMSKLPKAWKVGKQQRPEDPDIPTLGGDHAKVKEENIAVFVRNGNIQEWPVVLFQNGVVRTIIADCRVNEVGDRKPYDLKSRTQVPLVAGWAMTVHKSQGMTLDRVAVDLSQSFEQGQMYVALSRARSLEGLKAEGLGRHCGGNEQVRRFLSDNGLMKRPVEEENDQVPLVEGGSNYN